MRRTFSLLAALLLAMSFFVFAGGCGQHAGNSNSTQTAEAWMTQTYLALQDVSAAMTVTTQAVGTAYQHGLISEPKLRDIMDGLDVVDACWSETAHALLAYRMAMDAGESPARAGVTTAWARLVENRARVAALLRDVPGLAGLM